MFSLRYSFVPRIHQLTFEENSQHEKKRERKEKKTQTKKLVVNRENVENTVINNCKDSKDFNDEKSRIRDR